MRLIATVPLPAKPNPPSATASAQIYLSWPTGQEWDPLASQEGQQVQRLNNRKHVQYINTFADSNLSMRKHGLHKGLRTEDVTSDRAGGSRKAFSQCGGANGGRGRSSSSFVQGGVSYQPDGLIWAEGLYRTPHIWALTAGQTARDWISLSRSVWEAELAQLSTVLLFTGLELILWLHFNMH